MHEPSTTSLLSFPPGHALLPLMARPHRSLPICGEGMIPKTLVVFASCSLTETCGGHTCCTSLVRQTSRRVLPATLCCFCIGPCRCLHISARSGPLSECSLGSPRRTVWWLGSIATPTTTPSIWHTVVSCAESTQTKVAPWLMPSSCTRQRTIGTPPASPSGGAAACSGKSRRILQSSRSSGNCCNHRQPLPDKNSTAVVCRCVWVRMGAGSSPTRAAASPPAAHGAPPSLFADMWGGDDSETLIGSQKVFPHAPTPHRPRGPARPATTSGHGTLGDTQGVPRHTDHKFSSDVTPGNVRRCAKWLVHCLVMLHLLFVCTRISRERRAERQELCSPDPLRILTSGQPWGHGRRINFGEMGSLLILLM